MSQTVRMFPSGANLRRLSAFVADRTRSLEQDPERPHRPALDRASASFGVTQVGGYYHPSKPFIWPKPAGANVYAVNGKAAPSARISELDIMYFLGRPASPDECLPNGAQPRRISARRFLVTISGKERDHRVKVQ